MGDLGTGVRVGGHCTTKRSGWRSALRDLYVRMGSAQAQVWLVRSLFVEQIRFLTARERARTGASL